jgi:hypothetical protein
MFALAVSLWMAVAAPQPLSDDEVLATVNGTPITRRDLRDALTDRARHPLPNHLYARPAAIAAVCATQQGAYMPNGRLARDTDRLKRLVADENR